VNHGRVAGQPIRAAVADDAWLDTGFVTTVQQRGAAIIKARGLSSALSAASSVCDHVRDWVSSAGGGGGAAAGAGAGVHSHLSGLLARASMHRTTNFIVWGVSLVKSSFAWQCRQKARDCASCVRIFVVQFLTTSHRTCAIGC
jgi:hypothetical protein